MRSSVTFAFSRLSFSFDVCAHFSAVGSSDVLRISSHHILLTWSNCLYSFGSCRWISAALKIDSRYIQPRWTPNHSSRVSEKSRSFRSHSSTRFCIGPTNLDPRIVWTRTWWKAQARLGNLDWARGSDGKGGSVRECGRVGGGCSDGVWSAAQGAKIRWKDRSPVSPPGPPSHRPRRRG